MSGKYMCVRSHTMNVKLYILYVCYSYVDVCTTTEIKWLMSSQIHRYMHTNRSPISWHIPRIHIWYIHTHTHALTHTYTCSHVPCVPLHWPLCDYNWSSSCMCSSSYTCTQKYMLLKVQFSIICSVHISTTYRWYGIAVLLSVSLG